MTTCAEAQASCVGDHEKLAVHLSHGSKADFCFRNGIASRSILQVRGYIHPLVQDAHHVDLPGFGDAVEQEMRFNGQFAVTGTDGVDGSALPAAVRQCAAGITNAENVAFGSILAPITDAVVPDLRKVSLCGWR